MKFDQDLYLNLQYDFGKMNSTLGSVVPLAMFFFTSSTMTVYSTQQFWPNFDELENFKICLFVIGPMLKERSCWERRSRGLTSARSMLNLL